jgi:hypothetical protein
VASKSSTSSTFATWRSPPIPDARWLTRRSCAFYSAATVDADLAALEERLETLITYARELRAANELLRGELLASQERNRDLTARVMQAGERLDALIARMPVE